MGEHSRQPVECDANGADDPGDDDAGEWFRSDLADDVGRRIDAEVIG
ncbi:MAG: hypothetical protein KF904_14175 [Rhodoblastus sp.]|nr:hypothetical protein [Rhodoblastus sp.]